MIGSNTLAMTDTPCFQFRLKVEKSCSSAKTILFVCLLYYAKPQRKLKAPVIFRPRLFYVYIPNLIPVKWVCEAAAGHKQGPS